MHTPVEHFRQSLFIRLLLLSVVPLKMLVWHELVKLGKRILRSTAHLSQFFIAIDAMSNFDHEIDNDVQKILRFWILNHRMLLVENSNMRQLNNG